MSNYSEFTKEDYDLINKDYAELKEMSQKRIRRDIEMNVIQQAFDFANAAHKNVRRRSGEPYMLHPIEVAKIVVKNIGLGYKSIAAALLHDVVEDTDYTVDDIKSLFGDKIASLVEGLTKIKTVLDNEEKNKYLSSFTYSDQAENFKRILLTMNDDVRVVLIKLADRLHNCRTIEFMPERKRDKILSETMFIFVPLAHRLGLYEVKSEMEDIWLRFKEPEAYKDIRMKIQSNMDMIDRKIDEFIEPIDKALVNAGFKFRIKKRVKTPYSIWHKMQTKNVSFDQVYDLYAVRIIFDQSYSPNESERDQCYHIFSIITDMYRYNAGRVRDWVKHPKSNGYEALHCTLMSQFGSWIEVQIRSHRMDDIAEKGIAAHWAYKREGLVTEADSEMDKWLAKVKDILVSDDLNALELLDIIHNDLVTTEISVFTPKGKQKTIQKGATALDFAYTIHTDIGNKAVAAKANMKLVPLSYILKSGDQIEVITSESGAPRKEWLQFLTTRRARAAVTNYYKEHYRKDFIRKGEQFVSSYICNPNVRNDHATMKILLDDTQINDLDEVFFRIGLGIITSEQISKALSNPVWNNRKNEGEERYIIATCCHPIPGDPVLGFRTQDGSVEVHKKSCVYAESLASKHGEWVVVPDWGKLAVTQSYPVKIQLKGLDRLGLLNGISHYISMVLGVNIRKIYLSTDGGIFDGYIELFVKDKTVLDDIISSLSAIEGIQSVIRTEL